MAVNNSNLTGIPTRVAPPPNRANPATTPNPTPNTARATALANSPTPPPLAAPTAVTTPGAPAAAAIGGTTAPAGRAFTAVPTAPAQAQIGNIAAAMAMATSPALLAAMGAIAITTSSTRIKKTSGDAKEDSGDVELETESEVQPDALQEADQEQGAGEITEAGSTSGPAT